MSTVKEDNEGQEGGQEEDEESDVCVSNRYTAH